LEAARQGDHVDRCRRTVEREHVRHGEFVVDCPEKGLTHEPTGPIRSVDRKLPGVELVEVLVEIGDREQETNQTMDANPPLGVLRPEVCEGGLEQAMGGRVVKVPHGPESIEIRQERFERIAEAAGSLEFG